MKGTNKKTGQNVCYIEPGKPDKTGTFCTLKKIFKDGE